MTAEDKATFAEAPSGMSEEELIEALNEPIDPKTRSLLHARGLVPNKAPLNHRNAFGVFALTLLTFGLYIPLWQILVQRETPRSRDHSANPVDAPFWFILSLAGAMLYFYGAENLEHWSFYQSWLARSAAMGLIGALTIYSSGFVNSQVEAPLRASGSLPYATPSWAENLVGILLVLCGLIGGGELWFAGIALFFIAVWAGSVQASLNTVATRLDNELRLRREGEEEISPEFGIGAPWTLAEQSEVVQRREEVSTRQAESPYAASSASSAAQPAFSAKPAPAQAPVKSFPQLISNLNAYGAKPMQAFPQKRRIWLHVWMTLITLGLYWLILLPRLLRELPEHRRTFVADMAGFRLGVALAVSIGAAVVVAFSLQAIAEATRLDLQLIETPLQYPRLLFGVLSFYVFFGLSITWYLMVLCNRIRILAHLLGDHDSVARLPSRTMLGMGTLLSAPAVYLLGFLQVNALIQCLHAMNAISDRLQKLSK